MAEGIGGEKDVVPAEGSSLEGLNDEDLPATNASNEEVINNLSYGVLQHFLPDAQRYKATLSELTENQRILIETLQQENGKFKECTSLEMVAKNMEKAKLYQGKLLAIKKDMVMLHDKSAKLKKRALRLQQQKQKEELQKEQVREKELEQERMLIAKPASNKT